MTENINKLLSESPVMLIFPVANNCLWAIAAMRCTIHGVKRLIVGTTLLIAVFVGAAAAQRKCRPMRHAMFPAVKGLSYERARPKFIAGGWKPHKTNTESTAETNMLFGNGPLFWNVKGYIETTVCGGTNPGCEFIFKDEYDNSLYVYTYGLEDLAKHTHAKVTSYRIICDWEFK